MPVLLLFPAFACTCNCPRALGSSLPNDTQHTCMAKVITAALVYQSSNNSHRLKYYTYKFDPMVNITRVVVIFLFLCELGHNSFQQFSEVALLSSLREGLLSPLNIPVKDRAMWGLKTKPLTFKSSLLFTHLTYRSQTSSGSSPSYIRSSDSKALEKQKATKAQSICDNCCENVFNRENASTQSGCNVLKIIHTVFAGWGQSWVRPVVDWAPDVRLICLCPSAVAVCFLCLAPIQHFLLLPLLKLKHLDANRQTDNHTNIISY